MRGAAFFLALALLAPLPAWAAAPQCPAPPNPNAAVTLHTVVAKSTYRHDLARADIQKLRAKVDGSALNGHTIGLTVGRFHFETLANVLSGPARDGSTCLWLAKVDATLSIAEHTVYVAREYNSDSCEYNTIMDHENEHIRVNLAIFQEYAPRLDRELKAAVSRLNPVVAQRANASYATNMLNRAIKPILDEMERERAKRQAVLDTPENYRRTQAMCKRW